MVALHPYPHHREGEEEGDTRDVPLAKLGSFASSSPPFSSSCFSVYSSKTCGPALEAEKPSRRWSPTSVLSTLSSSQRIRPQNTRHAGTPPSSTITMRISPSPPLSSVAVATSGQPADSPASQSSESEKKKRYAPSKSSSVSSSPGPSQSSSSPGKNKATSSLSSSPHSEFGSVSSHRQHRAVSSRSSRHPHTRGNRPFALCLILLLSLVLFVSFVVNPFSSFLIDLTLQQQQSSSSSSSPLFGALEDVYSATGFIPGKNEGDVGGTSITGLPSLFALDPRSSPNSALQRSQSLEAQQKTKDGLKGAEQGAAANTQTPLVPAPPPKSPSQLRLEAVRAQGHSAAAAYPDDDDKRRHSANNKDLTFGTRPSQNSLSSQDDSLFPRFSPFKFFSSLAASLSSSSSSSSGTSLEQSGNRSDITGAVFQKEESLNKSSAGLESSQEDSLVPGHLSPSELDKASSPSAGIGRGRSDKGEHDKNQASGNALTKKASSLPSFTSYKPLVSATSQRESPYSSTSRGDSVEISDGGKERWGSSKQGGGSFSDGTSSSVSRSSSDSSGVPTNGSVKELPELGSNRMGSSTAKLKQGGGGAGEQGWKGELAEFADFNGDSHIDMIFISRNPSTKKDSSSSPSSSSENVKEYKEGFFSYWSGYQKAYLADVQGNKVGQGTKDVVASLVHDRQDGGLTTPRSDTFISVYTWNAGEGSFGFFGKTEVPDTVESLISLDWNGDGRTDIVAVCTVDDTSRILKARSEGEALVELFEKDATEIEEDEDEEQEERKRTEERKIPPSFGDGSDAGAEATQKRQEGDEAKPLEKQQGEGSREKLQNSEEKRGEKERSGLTLGEGGLSQHEGNEYRVEGKHFYLVAFVQRIDGVLERVWDSISSVDDLLGVLKARRDERRKRRMNAKKRKRESRERQRKLEEEKALRERAKMDVQEEKDASVVLSPAGDRPRSVSTPQREEATQIHQTPESAAAPSSSSASPSSWSESSSSTLSPLPTPSERERDRRRLAMLMEGDNEGRVEVTLQRGRAPERFLLSVGNDEEEGKGQSLKGEKSDGDREEADDEAKEEEEEGVVVQGVRVWGGNVRQGENSTGEARSKLREDLRVLPLLRFSSIHPLVADITMDGSPDLLVQLPSFSFSSAVNEISSLSDANANPAKPTSTDKAPKRRPSPPRRFVWLSRPGTKKGDLSDAYNYMEDEDVPLSSSSIPAVKKKTKVHRGHRRLAELGKHDTHLHEREEEIEEQMEGNGKRPDEAREVLNSSRPSDQKEVQTSKKTSFEGEDKTTDASSSSPSQKKETPKERAKEIRKTSLPPSPFLPVLWKDLSQWIENPEEEEKKENFGRIVTPHSSAFLDINGDCRPDLVFQVELPPSPSNSTLNSFPSSSSSPPPSQTFLEVWISRYDRELDRARYTRDHEGASIELPPNAGQISFADFNADGSLDLVIPTCTRSEVCNFCCVGSDKIVFAPNEQPGLCPSFWSLPEEHRGPCKSASNLCSFSNFTVPSLHGENTGNFTVADVDPDPKVHFYGDRDHPATLRVGDWNGDGYPDLAFIGVRNGGYRTARLYLNVPAKDSSGNSLLRTFELAHEFSPQENTDGGGVLLFDQIAFFDLFEDGSLDAFCMGQPRPPTPSTSPFDSSRAYLRTSDSDPRFLKATALTPREARSAPWAPTVSSPSFSPGMTGQGDGPERLNQKGVGEEDEEQGEKEKEAPKSPASLLQRLMVKDILPPYGVAGRGPCFKLTVTDLNGIKTARAAAQMSQSAHSPLQLPFALFGLGRTNNYIEEFYAGMPISSQVHYNMWISLIPNSQVLISPTPLYRPQSWQLDLSVNPSKHFLYILITTIICLLVVAIIIFILDQREKAEDSELQRGFRSHFIIN